jgi:light-regulated signal transduction histidine kinase (bacteriophytochrome)
MDREVASRPTKNYDSEFCGSIPIQLINLIQPHGMLLLLDHAFRLVQVSENTSHLLGQTAQQLVNQDFSALMSARQFEQFMQKISGRKRHNSIPLALMLDTEDGQKRFTAVIHIHPKFYLLELEPLEDSSSDITFISAYQDIKSITTALQDAADISSMSAIAAREIRAFSGFDRVMIYHFDRQWNGKVLAEAQEGSMEPYLNLTFPASDVPSQARALYLKNPYRLIPDIQAAPVRLYPVVNPVQGGFTDLSGCSLRSVPQVHLEYLHNMGVQASMSIPIIVDGKLWGLISCHHRTARWVPFETRYAFEVLSQLISSQIASRLRADRLSRLHSQRALELRLIEQIYRSTELSALLTTEGDALLELFDAGGACLLLEDQLLTVGNTPEENQLWDLIKWLKIHNREKIFHTNNLSGHFNKAAAYHETGSGLLSLHFSHSPAAYLMFFRPEIIQTVKWGGNPNDAIRFEENKEKYHPRNSFKMWQEEVRNTSADWEVSHLEVASNLRAVLIERILIDLQE